MKKLLVLTLLLLSCVARAQFYTIQPSIPKKITMDEKLTKGKKDSLSEEEVLAGKDQREFFAERAGYTAEIRIEKDIPVFVSATDSLMFGLLKQRMNVCLPLDFLKMNSDYGYRTDPINKCKRFHDGIDLKCNHARVYAMLPATVKQVHYGKTGYGNYVVLDHGNFSCLYAHLALITVSEGQQIAAGTIVGLSGSSGRSTGPHLHIKMLSSQTGKSINPEPFIAYLNNYIGQLQDKMAYLKFGTRLDMELSIANLYKALEKYDVKFKKIVVAQALLETGYFSSHVCREYNNLFGLRRPSDGHYYEFDSWEESVKAYRDYVQYKYKGGNYYAFLDKIGYAEAGDYIIQVRKIAESL